MNKYQLVKNIKWKEVEINSEIRYIPLHWNISTVEKKILEYPPSKNHASSGKKSGIYPFFNASQKQTMFCNDFNIDGEAIIITTGGDYAFSQYFNGKFSFSSHVWCFKLKEDNNKYFSYLFKYFFNEIQNLSVVGFKLKNLNKKDFKRIEFHFASIEEQSAISNILSNQESIVQDIESLISKYESRFQYLSEELLSGRLRVKEVDGQLTLYKNADDNWKEVEINGEMKEIPSDWQHSVVNKLFEIQRGKVLSKGYIQINAGNYPVYSSATENNGCIGRINSYMFDGEFLTWNTDGYAGSVFYRNGQFNCTNICGILKAKQPMNLHSFKFFLEPRFKKNVIHGGQLTNLKLMSSHVEGIELAYPQNSELELISLVFDKQEKLIEQQKELLAKEKQKFDWLLDNFLSGKYLIKEN